MAVPVLDAVPTAYVDATSLWLVHAFTACGRRADDSADDAGLLLAIAPLVIRRRLHGALLDLRHGIPH